MKLKIDGALPPLEFVPPRLNRFVLRLVIAAAPLYIKKSLGLHILPPQQPKKLIREYQDFFDGKSRLILVFRHVHVHDAQVVFYLFNNILPKESRRLNIRLPRHPHAHFLYGRGVPVWAGRWLEWLFSRVGGIPVFHRRLDREGLDELRSHLLHGEYPIALAPEGQVTYHNGVVHEIEPGFAHLALWAQQDLHKQGLSKDVRVLPISQYYCYGRDGEKSLQELVEKLEVELGIKSDQAAEMGYHTSTSGIHS
ncbi:MAG: hypothetical protein SVR04_10680 [Spirochaetota bacterium]|nr:hypothetical protein [Spirochaetota bacterium]